MRRELLKREGGGGTDRSGVFMGSIDKKAKQRETDRVFGSIQKDTKRHGTQGRRNKQKGTDQDSKSDR